MEVTQTAPTVLPPVTDEPTTTTAQITSDFDTFLQLLTAQMENQDPLDPMKSEDFTAQLATFSGVEQQVLTNQLLESMAAKLGSNDLAQMAGWVGNDVRAEMPARFDGTPVQIDPNMPIAGSRHQFAVYDANGAEVFRSAANADGTPFLWSGETNAGGVAASGTYTFQIESFQDGELVATDPVQTYGRVLEARAGRDGMMLVFAGGIEVPADAATALRAPVTG